MGNMSYCKFENTVKDIEDCLESLDDDLGEMSKYELRAYKRFLRLFVDNAEACEMTLEEREDEIDEALKNES